MLDGSSGRERVSTELQDFPLYFYFSVDTFVNISMWFCDL